MSLAKEQLMKLIETISDKDVAEVLDFIGYLQMKHEREVSKDLVNASVTSTDFWDNPVDDEVWNDV